ncbi:hypothetical protein HY407_01825 [Candidatus Gottesmanbacteria bacterium]|nr:hypothetical protein [Candidatus Gottesmanbacteria bacterium]
MDLGQRDILLRFAYLLEKYKISYLLTGSFAVAFYGYPRATHDIDFVIEAGEKDILLFDGMFSELDSSYIVDKYQIRQAIAKSTAFNILHPQSSIKTDFWLSPSGEFKRKFQRKREILVDRQKVSLISPEDLILNKLLWCKDIKSERHMRDCAGIWKVQKGNLDINYIKDWAKKLRVEELLEEIKVMDY